MLLSLSAVRLYPYRAPALNFHELTRGLKSGITRGKADICIIGRGPSFDYKLKEFERYHPGGEPSSVPLPKRPIRHSLWNLPFNRRKPVPVTMGPVGIYLIGRQREGPACPTVNASNSHLLPVEVEPNLPVFG